MKDTDLDSKKTGAPPFVSLGITVDQDFSFKKNIQNRTAKACAVALAMHRLQTSHQEIAPVASRSLYCGVIQSIVTYGCEQYTGTNTPHTVEMLRLEYRMRRRMRSALHGSSHGKLAAIIAIELRQVFIPDRSAAWAARAVRIENQHIRRFLELPPLPANSA